jgi:plastocyanin
VASATRRLRRGALATLLLCLGIAALVPAAQAGEPEPLMLEEAEPVTFRAPPSGGGISPEGSTAAVQVDIKDFKYLPKRIEVEKGAEVTWTNFDADEHSATADNGDFDTGLLAKGESGSVTLDKVGTFGYFCTLHPGMTATVVVAREDSGESGDSDDEDDDPAAVAGTSSSSGIGSTGFDSTGFDTGSAETLPDTGFEVLKVVVAAALFAAAGLLLLAWEMWLRPLPRGPGR